jgi:hypothetical protein
MALSNLLQAAYWSLRGTPIEQGYHRWGTKDGYCKLDPKFILSRAPVSTLCAVEFLATKRIPFFPNHLEDLL